MHFILLFILRLRLIPLTSGVALNYRQYSLHLRRQFQFFEHRWRRRRHRLGQNELQCRISPFMKTINQSARSRKNRHCCHRFFFRFRLRFHFERDYSLLDTLQVDRHSTLSYTNTFQPSRRCSVVEQSNRF